MSDKSVDQFEKTDPEKITGYLLEIFSSDIRWESALVKVGGVNLGVFKVYEAVAKPVIAKKNEGRDQAIKNGEVYFRYGGRTQKIQSAELENIINRRIEQNNQQWLDLMSKIGKAGPQNAAILDTERAVIEKDDTRILVLDEDLAGKIKIIKEGQFVEKTGADTLKLVGDIVPVNKVEVIRRVKENLIKSYPLSALELAEKIVNICPIAKQNDVWKVISDNDIKNNTDYSAYVFRNKKQEDTYRETGVLPAVPSIYNENAVTFIVKIIEVKNDGI